MARPFTGAEIAGPLANPGSDWQIAEGDSGGERLMEVHKNHG